MIDEFGVLAPNRKGPRWDKIKLPFYGHVTLGNGTMFCMYIAEQIGADTPDMAVSAGRRLFVGVERCGAFGFAWGSWKHFNYVNEKLTLGDESDAAAIADLLNTIMDSHGEFKEQGEYTLFYPPRLCEKCRQAPALPETTRCAGCTFGDQGDNNASA